MEPIPKAYIGDGIYAEDDGFSIVLTTDNGQEVTNRIVIEPSEIESLEHYINRFRAARRHGANPETSSH